MKQIILGGLLATLLLAACGQKGNLYLPTPTSPASSPTSGTPSNPPSSPLPK